MTQNLNKKISENCYVGWAMDIFDNCFLPTVHGGPLRRVCPPYLVGGDPFAILLGLPHLVGELLGIDF